jgi:hypothetical protein
MKVRHPLLSIVPLLAMIAVLPGCPEKNDHAGGHCSADASACVDGVAINLDSLATTFAEQMPVTVTVCFDKSCDEVTLEESADGAITCLGKDGGAPDQLTYCEPLDDGTLRFEIVRTDGADYSDGSTHHLGVSVRNAARGLLWTGTVATNLSASVTDNTGTVCHQDSVALDPTLSTPSGQ